MRPFRRIFALFPLLAVSISGVAAQQQQSQASSQAPPQAATPQAAEGPLASAARELARKLAASLGADLKGKLTVDPNPANLSLASSFDFQQGCAAFDAELASAGMTLPQASMQQATATVHITLSSSFQGFLWVADVTQAAAHKLFFSSVVPLAASTAPPAAPQLTLLKTFLLSSPDPILDAELLPSPSGPPPSLLILQPERIALFLQANGAWQFQSEATVKHDHPWPRDLRGRLLQVGAAVEAYFPGTSCVVATAPMLSVSCGGNDDPWAFLKQILLLPPRQTHFLVDGNSFLSNVGGSQMQFVSLADLPPAPNGRLVLIGTIPDGRALLFEGGSATPVASFAGWGSDIAALWSRTRQRWPILVTRNGDWTQPDAIQAFDIVEHQAVPVSAPLDFEDPITALWPEGENEALAVSRNLKTGLYEAYLLRATYNQ